MSTRPSWGASPQAMAVGDQDHGRIPMPVAAMLSGAVHQPVDLALGEVAPLDCQVYDAWGAFLGCRFHAGKPCLRVSYCIGYTPFLNSQLRLPSRSRPINRGWQSAGIFPHRDAKLSAPLRPQHWCGRCAPGRGTFGFWKAHLKGALSPSFYECTPR